MQIAPEWFLKNAKTTGQFIGKAGQLASRRPKHSASHFTGLVAFQQVSTQPVTEGVTDPSLFICTFFPSATYAGVWTSIWKYTHFQTFLFEKILKLASEKYGPHGISYMEKKKRKKSKFNQVILQHEPLSGFGHVASLAEWTESLNV